MAEKKEYIERSEVIRTILGQPPEHYPELYYRYIKELPAADVLEVVRCKDCKHCKKHPTSDKVKMCTNEQQGVTDYYPLVHDTDFCSYGERKEATP